MGVSAVRKARNEDLARIAEIFIFNYRLYFYPIFRNDGFYFEELQVPAVMAWFADSLEHIRVYDDGVVKGFIHGEGQEVRRLFVEPVLHSAGIGGQLLEQAIAAQGVNRLWALEKNLRAIAFYQRYGFRLTDKRKPEEDTDEYLVLLERA